MPARELESSPLACTVFGDLVGDLSSIPSTEWLKLARLDEFFLAGYNDAISYAELIVIHEGVGFFEFLVFQRNQRKTLTLDSFLRRNQNEFPSCLEL